MWYNIAHILFSSTVLLLVCIFQELKTEREKDMRSQDLQFKFQAQEGNEDLC